jgi:hypothetical protein
MGEKRNAYNLLVGKRPLERLRRCRWVDNIKMDVLEIGRGLVWRRIGTSGELL